MGAIASRARLEGVSDYDYFQHRKAELNWCRLFQDMLGDFSVAGVAARQAAALAKAGLAAAQ